MGVIIKVLMYIDMCIYNLIDYVYDIFNALAKTNIFDENDYTGIVQRIYVILGMVMLFVLAYSLLKAVINPDEFAKGENSFPKIISNVVVSLVIIAVLPTVFTVAFNVQNTILNYDTIPKLILGNKDFDSHANDDAGRKMAYYVMSAFLHPNYDWCNINKDEDGNVYSTTKGYYVEKNGKYYETDGLHDVSDVNLSQCAHYINGNGWLGLSNGAPLDNITAQFHSVAIQGEGIATKYEKDQFLWFGTFSEAVDRGEVTYNVLVSTVAAAFLLYVLLNFCFDMAVRVIKLMFFQIIAPIPVVCRIIPGGKMKDVFSTWLKKTVSCFMEVFIRIAIMYLGVYIITLVNNKWTSLNWPGLGFLQKNLAFALVILGIVLFIREAPKLIGEIFHLDSGSMKLGLMDKLSQSGALAAGAFIGGGLGALSQNLVAGVKGVGNARRNGRLGVGAALHGIGSTLAGGLSGAIHGGYNARGAKNLRDMASAAGKGVATARKNRTDRAAYRAQFPSGPGGSFESFMRRNVSDRVEGGLTWLGIGNDLESLKQAQEFNNQIIAIDDNSDSVAADLLGRDAFKNSVGIMAAASGGKYTMSYAAMQERINQLGNLKYDDVVGHDLMDLAGTRVTINDENAFANYMARMKSQLGEAERNAKKYIKQQGYRGQSGVNDLNLEIQASDLIAATNAFNSVDLMNAADNRLTVSYEQMGIDLSNVNSLDLASALGTQTDFYGNRHTITNEAELNAYKELMRTQYNESRQSLVDYMKRQASRGAVGLTEINRLTGLNLDSTVFTSTILGSGELQRMAKLDSDRANIQNLVAESGTAIAALNDADSTTVQVAGVNSYDDMDQLTQNAKNNNIAINAEKERLAREEARRHPNNNGGSSGH